MLEKTPEQRKVLQSALSGASSFSVEALAVIMKEKVENPDFLTEVKRSQSEGSCRSPRSNSLSCEGTEQ